MRTLIFGLFFAPALVLAQSSTATYTVTFESTWSATTHPDDFPPDPHFSGLIGAAHNATATLWEPGELASPGIEQMAETGAKTLLESEVNDLITAGSAFDVLSGGGIALSPGSVALTFDLTTEYPLVSLVSMVAPSPDWFVGVNGLSLYDGSNWTPNEVVTLYVYDSGTDSGVTYTSPDEDTQPPDPIFLIDGYPFFYDGSIREIGTFTFHLDNVVAAEDNTPTSAQLRMSAPFPNPAAIRSTLLVNVGTPQSVSVDLFDMLGRRVRSIQNGHLTAGTHQLAIDTNDLPKGVYIIRLMGPNQVDTRRLVVQ